MDEYIKYTSSGIYELNKTKIFNESLDTKYVIYNEKKREKKKKKETNYVLHATNECDIKNGRKYIALPVNIDIKDKDIRIKYNLI